MLTQSDITKAVADAERASANGERLVRKLTAERGSTCDATMRAAYDARILAVHRATMAQNEYMDALHTVAKRIPRYADTIAPTVKAEVKPTPKAATIERKPIVDNGDDPSIAHAEPKAKRVRKPKAERMTLSGRMMPTDKPASDAQIERLRKFGAKRIAKGLSVADASDRLYKLRNK